MKKFFIIVAIIVANLFYYNICRYEDGSIVFVTFNNLESDSNDFGNALSVLRTKKVAYIKFIDNKYIGFLSSDNEISFAYMDEDQLSAISAYMTLRGGLVQKKSILVGLASIVIGVIIIKKKKPNNELE